MNDKLINAFYATEEVEALVLGGSRGKGTFDEHSDYDLYVYLSKPLNENKRKAIINSFVRYMEYSNEYWELEDDGILIENIDIEFIYRTIDEMDKIMGNILIKGYVSHGYSTCFVDNLFNSKIIFDKNNRLESLRYKYRKLLNKEFYDKIINYNFPILMDKMPSLYFQIEKAMKRNDVISINHRSTAYFEIYFDILFALNQITHPGEKRMLETASIQEKVPKDIDINIKKYYKKLYVENSLSLDILKKITVELYILLKDEGYDFKLNSYK